MSDAGANVTAAYDHRSAFCAWINDIGNQTMPNEPCPCVILGDQTVKDWTATLELCKQAGFNELNVAGLAVSYSRPLDIVTAVSKDRERRVDMVIEAAHKRGIKVFYVMGVYSWGFDKIIESYPGVRGTNPHTMCGSKRDSQRWMERVIDYIVSEFDVDGFHLEASDLGRCKNVDCTPAIGQIKLE